jgi:hypothetical protein
LAAKGGLKSKKPKIFGVLFPATFHFSVVHHNGRNAKRLNHKVFSQNHEAMKYFQKLENNMVLFFSSQFEKVQADEIKSIKGGLQNDNDTLYVIGLDNGAQNHVVAAVQYIAPDQGAYINWLAVESSGKTSTHFGPGNNGLVNLWKIGLGTFLQELVLLM